MLVISIIYNLHFRLPTQIASNVQM